MPRQYLPHENNPATAPGFLLPLPHQLRRIPVHALPYHITGFTPVTFQLIYQGTPAELIAVSNNLHDCRAYCPNNHVQTLFVYLHTHLHRYLVKHIM